MYYDYVLCLHKKMKNWVKFWLIVLGILAVILLICAFLVKAWIISSWILPNCYEICEWNCKKNDGDFMCHNDCITKCITPKIERCRKECKLSEEIEWKYNYENYDAWFKQRSLWEEDWNWSEKYWHDVWINEEFDWYQDEIEEYESCKNTCEDEFSDMLYQS